MIERKNIVWKSDLRFSFYFSIVQDGKGQVKLYRNNFNLGRRKTIFTDYMISEDGLKFKKPLNNKILKGSCLSHNFFPFIGQDGKYYGIGGMDSWKNNIKWHSNKNFEKFKGCFLEKYGREYDKDEARYLKAYKRLTTEEYILDYSDGLFLLESSNGVNWKIKNHIILATHEGYNSALQWKASEFDGHLCCMHNGSVYILYVRNNIGKGSRFIQFSVSKDLINWSKFKNIKITPNYDIKTENYYYPCFFKYNNFFVGLLPYYVKDKACIRLVKSNDGVNWEVTKDLFVSKPFIIQGKEKNPCHPVNGGVVKSEGKINLYMHENYQGEQKDMDVTVSRYEITEKNFNKMLKV